MKTTGTNRWADGSVLLLIIVLMGLFIVVYQGTTVGSQGTESLTITGRYRPHTVPAGINRPEGLLSVAPLLGPEFVQGAVISETDLSRLSLTVHVPPISADTEYISGSLLAAMPPVLVGPAGRLRIELDPALSDLGVQRVAGETIVKGGMPGHITYQDGTRASVGLHIVVIPERHQGNFSLIINPHQDRSAFWGNFGDLDLTPALIQTVAPNFFD